MSVIVCLHYKIFCIASYPSYKSTGVTLFAFLYRNLQVSEVWAFGDQTAFPQDITIIENWAFSAWSSQVLGFISLNHSPIICKCYIYQLIGDNLAQKLCFCCLNFPLQASIFSSEIKIGIIASVTGSLIYSVNPITIAELVGGSMTLAAYASFPVILLFILKIVKKINFLYPIPYF